MSKILFVTDSASDISVEHEKELGIRVLNYKVTLDDKEYISRTDLDNKAFYSLLANSDGIPKTAQITPFQFEDLYKEYYEQGYTDIIQILINAEASATYQNSVLALQSFYEENPQAKSKMTVYTIEGRSYTGAYGYAVVEAARMAQAGKSVDEIRAFVGDWLLHSRIYAGLFTLKYAARSGRISSVTAFVGEALGMKPIMRICDHGITTKDKVRGERAIVPFIAKKVQSEIRAGSPYMIVYGENEEDRDRMAAAAEAALGYPPVDSYQIGPIIAAHAGPRVVGIIFKANE